MSGFRAGVVAGVMVASIASLGHAESDLPFVLRAEGGVGVMDVRPVEAQSSAAAGALLSLGWPSRGRTHGLLELGALTGGPLPAGVIPEAARPGSRALYTALVGIERCLNESDAGAFSFIGAGIGRHTLDGARPAIRFPAPASTSISSRRLTACAMGAGLGYRSEGTGPVRAQVALRAHAILSGGKVPASSFLMTLGLAF